MDAEFARILGCSLCGIVSRTTFLLDCLHSCCEACVGDDDKQAVTCKKCKLVTTVSGRNRNRFASARAKALSLSLESAICGICSEKGMGQQEADQWCRACGQALCFDCATEHQWHMNSHAGHVVSLVEVLPELAVSASASQSCDVHGEKYSFICKHCQTVKCSICLKECLSSKHDAEHLLSKGASDFVQLLKHRIGELQGLLKDKRRVVTAATKLGELQRARKRGKEALQRNKKDIMEAVDRVYKAAEDELDSMYDSIAAAASDSAAAAELLEPAIEQAICYSECVLNFSDTVSLLERQQQLVSRLQSLVDEVSSAPASVDPGECVTIESSLPDRLDEELKRWIGVLKLRSSLPSGPSQEDDTEESELRLGTASSYFMVATQLCYDVAVTADGCLLVAAMEQGMQEYDESGRQLSCWTPDRTAEGREDSVWTVDELQHGRVAVGLNESRAVQLLRRSPAARDSWLQEQRVIELQGPLRPRQLSVHADLLALATGSSELLLLSLSDGRGLRRQLLDYRIWSVAATAAAVVTASLGKVKLSDGTMQHVLDSHSHAGQQQWRQSWDEQVYDICAAPASAVLYLALQDSDRVAAVRAEDGQLLHHVLCNCSHGLQRPYRLSLSRGQRTVLAVLGSDYKTVTVYPALGSRGSSKH